MNGSELQKVYKRPIYPRGSRNIQIKDSSMFMMAVCEELIGLVSI